MFLSLACVYKRLGGGGGTRMDLGWELLQGQVSQAVQSLEGTLCEDRLAERNSACIELMERGL